MSDNSPSLSEDDTAHGIDEVSTSYTPTLTPEINESQIEDDDNDEEELSQKDPLNSLGVRFVEQDFLERRVAETADKSILKREIELDEKRLSKAKIKYDRFIAKKIGIEEKLNSGRIRISSKENLRKELDQLVKDDLNPLLAEIKEIRARLDKSKSDVEKVSQDLDASEGSLHQLPTETKQEFLIRTGKITAFGSASGFIEDVSSGNNESSGIYSNSVPSHQNLLAPGLESFGLGGKSQIKSTRHASGNVVIHPSDEEEEDDKRKHIVNNDDESDYSPEYIEDDDNYEDKIDIASEDDYQDNDDDYDIYGSSQSKKKAQKRKHEDVDEEEEEEENFQEEIRNIDDGDELFYQKRLRTWIEKRSSLRKENRPDYQDDPSVDEWLKPHPTANDAILNDEYKMPGDIYPSLFDYQKTGVQWLWELYSQNTGGIVGDEMGLGKTIQIIAFLAGLHYSGKLDKPVLIVCPATVMRQWCNEFHRWWPPLRVMILHSIGSGMSNSSNKKSKSHDDDDFIDDENELEELLGKGDKIYSQRGKHSTKSMEKAKHLVEKVLSRGHVLITTYAGVRIYARQLIPIKWGYVVLDEGHKIRNPDSFITLTCKQLRTPNRIILSGTPIQNNLIELWSLFDFIFPGRLGTLPVFQREFSIPINLGGYANATNVQVQTGYKCAVILRDLISPYLLRRVKADVAKDLPKKNEMVLFCKLTKNQRVLYENFLKSEELTSIIKGRRNVLYGVDILRKICNHPDLVDMGMKNKTLQNQSSKSLEEKSGKLQVVKTLIQLWRKEGRKCLIFTQTRQMLDILVEFITVLNRENIESDANENYQFLRMDGTTPISQRQSLVDLFNNDPNYDIFLLTTRVGGLGVNLTGASRVVIYDPDWNPSTDLQARERAWRLGQKRDVTIYRLMIAGSIEEKIYHRQIFKQFLTNKILKDPQQKRFFKMNDLYDLFSLDSDKTVKGSDTSDRFNANEVRLGGNKERKSRMLTKNQIRNPNNNNNKDGEASQSDNVEKDDFLEVSKIKGVHSLQNYDYGDGNSGGDKSGESNEDSGLMAGIFSKASSVHSIVEHDSVMKNGTSADVSRSMIDMEASRIASEAVRALKESRKLTRRAGAGVPTWTGKYGKAGKVNPLIKKSTDHRGVLSGRLGGAGNSSGSSNSGSGLNPLRNRMKSNTKSEEETGVFSSSRILANIKERASLNNNRSRSSSPAPAPDLFATTMEKIRSKNANANANAGSEGSSSKRVNEAKLAERLSNYMAGLDGFFSKSGDILDALNIDVSDEKLVNIVRSMLKEISKWDSRRKGWVLKEEFR
ncbi:hypothetical protein BVG19_g4927 [[Candida] boidinii]|nr:hypothetical protein BVG19_g4927 [[Candida] boidinii]OWB51875.1 hydrolase activity protein [[Candida] boidinii]OWB85710.1 hydrolase activity protein [[Candida] boidinii]